MNNDMNPDTKQLDFDNAFWTLVEYDKRALQAEEKAARRLAKSLGMRIVKARTRNPSWWSYGLYSLVDAQTNFLIWEMVTLDQIDGYLKEQFQP